MTQSKNTTGLPGLRGGDHVGLTVPDMEQAVAFFTEVIGAETVFAMGPFADPEGSWMQDQLNVHPRAVISSIRFLRCGNGLNLELFQYTAPDQTTALPKNSDIGGYHIAFYTDDFDQALQHLQEKGVAIQGTPVTAAEGPNAGMRWVYFLAPWGLQLELVSYPRGMAYEANTDTRLWRP